MSFKLPKLIGK